MFKKFIENKRSKDIYIAMCNCVAVLTIFLLELVAEVNLDIVKWLNVSGMSDKVVDILSYLLHAVLFSVLYYFLRWILLLIVRKCWEKKKSRCNLKGTWLHIHEKEVVKIGVADITQDFYDITVRGENVQPNTYDDDIQITNWHYACAEFDPDDSVKLIGCYLAHRQQGINGQPERTKQGVHLFTELVEENGKVVQMKGEFGDALRVGNKENGPSYGDQTGKIYFFRMTPAMEEYLGYESIKKAYNKDKLIWIMNETERRDIADSDFVKTLKKAYNKSTFRKEWKNFKEEYDKIADSCGLSWDEIELSVYKLIACTIYADRKVDRAEKAMLTDLTGILPKQYPHSALNKEEVFAGIGDIMKTLRGFNKVLSLFTGILDEPCRAIILANMEVTASEETFMEELANVTAPTHRN